AVSVALRFSERVIHTEVQLRVKSSSERDDQLVLFETARRFILEEVVRSEWANTAAGNKRIKCAGQGGIKRVRAKLMQRSRVTERYAGRETVWQRVLETNGGLHRVRRLKIFRQTVNRNRCRERRQ